MSDDMNPTDEDLANDLFGNTEYKAADATPKKEFLPWHRPRKQYVRHWQWFVHIEKIIKEVAPESRTLRYLGLPGEDLLDLRYFHEHICVPYKIDLKFLGFNRGLDPKLQNADINVSLDEVKRLSYVDPASELIADDICQIANKSSIAFDRSKKMGPYDVINIDLCDGFGKHPVGEFKFTHYDTLNQLLAIQAHTNKPWLLLLTTRTGSTQVDKGVFERLKGLYLHNLINCTLFNDLSTKNYSIKDAIGLEQNVGKEKVLADIFLVSLCKWIGGLCTSQNPPAKVEVVDVMGYIVDTKAVHKDLVSIAIKITPTFNPKSG